MPGKYPTITSPESSRSTIDAEFTGTSRSDRATLKKMFPKSPTYYSDSTTSPPTPQSDASYRAVAAGKLKPIIQGGDLDHFPNGVNMLYQGSSESPLVSGLPEFPTDPTQYEGRYLPYLVVPSDPAAGVDGTSTEIARDANDNFGSGAKVIEVQPVLTTAKINQTTINVDGPIAPLGQSGANLTSGGTQSTHEINPGAISNSSSGPE